MHNKQALEYCYRHFSQDTEERIGDILSCPRTSTSGMFELEVHRVYDAFMEGLNCGLSMKGDVDKPIGKSWWVLLLEVLNKNDDCSLVLKSSFPEISDEYLKVRYLWSAMYELERRIAALEGDK